MSAESRGTGSRETPVDHIIASFLEAAEEGRQPDPREYLRRYPEFSEELRSFFSGYGHLQGAAGGRPPHVDSTGIEKANLAETNHSAAGLPPKRQRLVPKIMGRYRLLRILGKGAMGAVFLADDTQVGRQVALKVPTLDMSEDPTLRERFYREARAAALVRHPNICAVFDVGEAEGFQFIAMAYVSGVPLSKFVNKDRPLAPRKTAVVIKKLALALGEAHQAGIVHRDLKPANIMINEQGEPIIMDFGLARLNRSADDVRVTRTGMIVGSPAYMSPEQVTADHDAIGPSADIYSLGVVLYELLTGRLPFTGNGRLMALVAQIQRDPPPPLSSLRADVPRDLETLCLRMLAKSIADRPASMKAVAESLSDFLAGRSSFVDPQEITQPLMTPPSNDATAETMLFVAEPDDRLTDLPAADSAAETSEECDLIFVEADSALTAEGSDTGGTDATNPSPFISPSGPKHPSQNSQVSLARRWTFRAAGMLVLLTIVASAWTLKDLWTGGPASPKTTAEPAADDDHPVLAATAVVAPSAVTPLTKPITDQPVQPPKADEPPSQVPVNAVVPLRPELVLMSVPRRSSLANGGNVLHLGVRNERRIPRTGPLRAQVVDQNDRLLTESLLTDAADLRGRIIVKLDPDEPLPERIRLKLIDPETNATLVSDSVMTSTVTGIKTVPISLSALATRGLHDDLHGPGRTTAQHSGLTEMSPGRHILGGVEFEVEDGLIELQSSSTPTLPAAAFDLRVRQAVSRLHFLLACPVPLPGLTNGTQVGHFRVNYQGGATETIPIRYGVHLESWVSDLSKTSLDDGTLAWIGANRNSLTKGQFPHATRLYVVSWTNPRPETSVDSLDVFSELTSASFVCVALSVERVDDAGVFAEQVNLQDLNGPADGGVAAWRQAQRDAVDWALGVGGVVFISDSDAPVTAMDELPPRFTVTSLGFNSKLVTDDDLVRFRLLTKLNYLRLERASLTGDGLKHLAELPELTHLVLAESQIDDEGLRDLKSLPFLKRLELQDTKITDAGLAYVAECPHLEYMRLSRQVLTDDGVASLALLPDLNSLWIDADDSSLERIIKELKLKELTLQSRVSPRVIAELAKMNTLRKLTLSTSFKSGNPVKALGTLTQIRQLRLHDFSKSELQQLRKLLPNCQIEELH